MSNLMEPTGQLNRTIFDFITMAMHTELVVHRNCEMFVGGSRRLGYSSNESDLEVKALMRRFHSQQQPASGWDFEDDALRIDLERRLVEARGQEIHLTRLEFELLKYLAERPGIPVGRSELIDNVWGYEFGGDINDGAVNTAVAKLRAKIEPDPTNPRYIHSVHGIGYRFKKT